MSLLPVPRIIPSSHKPGTKDGSDEMKLLIVDDHAAMRRLVGRQWTDSWSGPQSRSLRIRFEREPPRDPRVARNL